MASIAYASTVNADLVNQVTDNSGSFVVPAHVVAAADTSGTYTMFTNTATANNTTAQVNYDYIYDYTLASNADAAAFCNAFDVSGANAFNTTANALQQAVFDDSNHAVRTILLGALATNGAKAPAGTQTARPGALLRDSLGVIADENINTTLTKRLNYIINVDISDSGFDIDYYPDAVAGNPGAPAVQDDALIDITLDTSSGVAVLDTSGAATNAVLFQTGALALDATTLAKQIPGSNMALYADGSGNIPTSLLLKTGDTVTIAFSVKLGDIKVASHTESAVGDPLNSAELRDTFPRTLRAAPLTIDIQRMRPVVVAVRLHMPTTSGSGVKIPGVRTVVQTHANANSHFQG